MQIGLNRVPQRQNSAFSPLSDGSFVPDLNALAHEYARLKGTETKSKVPFDSASMLCIALSPSHTNMSGFAGKTRLKRVLA